MIQSNYYSLLIIPHLDASERNIPVTVTIKSSGTSAEELSDLLGIYSILPNSSQYGRPVWKQKGNNDFFIFYSGNFHLNHEFCFTDGFPGKNWYVSDAWKDETTGFVASISRGRVMIPEEGWQYSTTDDENPWIEDENIVLSGKKMNFEFI